MGLYGKYFSFNLHICFALAFAKEAYVFASSLFEKQHTEHLNTIKRLFQRFRVANKSFFAKKKDAHALDYQAFLTLKFPALFLS